MIIGSALAAIAIAGGITSLLAITGHLPYALNALHFLAQAKLEGAIIAIAAGSLLAISLAMIHKKFYKKIYDQILRTFNALDAAVTDKLIVECTRLIHSFTDIRDVNNARFMICSKNNQYCEITAQVDANNQRIVQNLKFSVLKNKYIEKRLVSDDYKREHVLIEQPDHSYTSINIASHFQLAPEKDLKQYQKLVKSYRLEKTIAYLFITICALSIIVGVASLLAFTGHLPHALNALHFLTQVKMAGAISMVAAGFVLLVLAAHMHRYLNRDISHRLYLMEKALKNDVINELKKRGEYELMPLCLPVGKKWYGGIEKIYLTPTITPGKLSQYTEKKVIECEYRKLEKQLLFPPQMVTNNI